MAKTKKKKDLAVMSIKWLFCLLVLVACNSGKQKTGLHATGGVAYDSLKNDSITIAGKQAAHDFWDSISMQLQLSDAQMIRYTIMDSFIYMINRIYKNAYPNDYTEAWGMYGDSVYSSRGLKIAILEYRDGVCLKKYLLVFDKEGRHNLGYTEIEESCDSDGEDSPYSSQDYRIINDSLFETIGTDDPGAADSTDKNITTTITKWKISRNGAIDSIRGKLIKKEPRDNP